MFLIPLVILGRRALGQGRGTQQQDLPATAALHHQFLLDIAVAPGETVLHPLEEGGIFRVSALEIIHRLPELTLHAHAKELGHGGIGGGQMTLHIKGHHATGEMPQNGFKEGAPGLGLADGPGRHCAGPEPAGGSCC